MRASQIRVPKANLFLNGKKPHENIIDYLEEDIYSEIGNPEQTRALKMFLREGDLYLNKTNLLGRCKDNFRQIFNFIKWLKYFLSIASEIMSQPNKESLKKLSRLFNQVRFAENITAIHKNYLINQVFSLLREAPWTETLKLVFFTATKDQTQSYFEKISDELTVSARSHLEKCIDLKRILSTQSPALLLPFTEQLLQDSTSLSGKNLSDLIFRLLVLTKELRIQSLDTSHQVELYRSFQQLIDTKERSKYKLFKDKRSKHTTALNNISWNPTAIAKVQASNSTIAAAAACLHQSSISPSHKKEPTKFARPTINPCKSKKERPVASTGSAKQPKISKNFKNKKAAEALYPDSKAQQLCQELWQTKISALQLTDSFLSGDINQFKFMRKHTMLMTIQIEKNKQITNSRGNAPTPLEFQSFHEPTSPQHNFQKFIAREKSKLIHLKNATRNFYKNRTTANKEKLDSLLVEICHPLPEAVHFVNDSQAISLQLLNCLAQIESLTDEVATKQAQSSRLFQAALKEKRSLLFWEEPSHRTGKECAFGVIGDNLSTNYASSSSSKQASPISITSRQLGDKYF